VCPSVRRGGDVAGSGGALLAEEGGQPGVHELLVTVRVIVDFGLCQLGSRCLLPLLNVLITAALGLVGDNRRCCGLIDPSPFPRSVSSSAFICSAVAFPWIGLLAMAATSTFLNVARKSCCSCFATASFLC
jgi:hypothetical protein